MATDKHARIATAGALFTECRRRWGLLPEEVLGLLEVTEIEKVRGWDREAFQNALERMERLLTLPSGRVLRPATDQTNLEGIMARVEERAWASLRQYRFAEFGHWAELWASLAKVSGETWRNPFSEVATLGRKHRKTGKQN